MKKLNLLITIVVTGLFMLTLNAQQKNANISFEKSVHDFGKVDENKGSVTYKFNFTNTGSVPLIIKNVQATCGCTTPNWTREPVIPGSKGFVSVTYDPKNRPGKINKSITITYNGNPETAQLQIVGDVIPKTQSIEDIYTYAIDSIRFKSQQIVFPNLPGNTTQTQSLEFINTSSNIAKLNIKDLPAHLNVKIIPAIVKPQATGKIEVTYDAVKKNDWGFLVDRFTLVINDKVNGNNILNVTANIVEDFASLTEEQKKNAPSIKFIDTTTYDFGTIKTGEMVKHEYKFTNTGKSDLIIRKITPSCGCTAVNTKNNIIKPGETSSITSEFNSSGRTGSQTKTITIITNDPINPRTILWIKGMVQ